MNDTRRVAETFFAAWTTGREADTRALMHDDLSYTGPLNTYDSAEALLAPLIVFAARLRGVRLVELIVEGDRAAMLYDCELPLPVGTLRTASFLRVTRGKIATILHAFDAGPLRELQSRGA